MATARRRSAICGPRTGFDRELRARPGFRTAFRKTVTAREKQYSKSGFLALIPDGRTKPVPADFTIIYGVMRHPNARTKSLAIPFFSKIALRAVAERLDLMGFRVELHLIAKL